MDTDKAWTRGATWAKSLRFNKVKKTGFGEKYLIFPAGFYVSEEEGEKESIQAFFR